VRKQDADANTIIIDNKIDNSATLVEKIETLNAEANIIIANNRVDNLATSAEEVKALYNIREKRPLGRDKAGVRQAFY